MKNKRFFSVSAAFIVTAAAAACSAPDETVAHTAPQNENAANITTSSALETTAAETTAGTTVGETAAEKPEYTFGRGLNVLGADVIPIEQITDESVFGNVELIAKLRQKCFEEKADEISELNRNAETPVSSADDIRFIRGHICDLNRDGTDDYVVNLFYSPNYNDGYDVPGSVLYYIDGMSGDIRDLINGGTGSTKDGLEELWDFGEFTVVTEIGGTTPLSIGVDLIKINPDSSIGYAGYACDIRSPENGIMMRLDHPSAGYQYLPAVFTEDGEYKKIGFEEIPADEFMAYLEADKKLKEWYDTTAEHSFGSADTDVIDKVYTCGYYAFMIYCKPELKEYEYERYIYYSPVPTDYPPVIIDDEFGDDRLHGVNLNKLNIINR